MFYLEKEKTLSIVERKYRSEIHNSYQIYKLCRYIILHTVVVNRMEPESQPIKERLKDNKNIIYLCKEKEFIIVKNLDTTLKLLDLEWEVIEDLADGMFLMSKIVKPANENSEL